MAELSIGLWVERIASGVKEILGSVSGPYRHSQGSKSLLTTSGTGVGPRKSTVVEAEDISILWDYSDDSRNIEYAVINSDQTGYVCLFVDAATAGGSAAGTAKHWYYVPCSNLRPVTIGGSAMLTKATASDPTADIAGLPSLPTDGSVVVGKLFKIAFYNPQTGDATVDLAIFS
jgi:hypothetical protein